MKNLKEIPALQMPLHEVWQTLDLSCHASLTEVRKRYLERVREFPPDLFPEQFNKLQTAYEIAQDRYLIWHSKLQPHGQRAVLESIQPRATTSVRLPTNLLLSAGD